MVRWSDVIAVGVLSIVVKCLVPWREDGDVSNCFMAERRVIADEHGVPIFHLNVTMSSHFKSRRVIPHPLHTMV